MDIVLLILTVILTIAGLGYHLYQANQHQKHHPRNRFHQRKGNAVKRAPHSVTVCSSLDEVALQMEQKLRTKQRATSYRCISIVSNHISCAAQKSLSTKRFLSSEAPTLPLPTCNRVNCHCRYQHFDDRRIKDSERRFHSGLSRELYSKIGEANRRVRFADRRSYN